jgi:hypothetical protein
MIFGQWIYFAICLQALESASIGVCFGHQVIALSMGDMCSQHSATKLRLNELGKKVYRVESGVLVGVSQLPLLLCSYSHKEPSFDVLGPCSHHIIVSSDNSPNHGMVRFSQSESLGDAPPLNFCLTDIRILTSQGHPEFTESIMCKFLRTR